MYFEILSSRLKRQEKAASCVIRSGTNKSGTLSTGSYVSVKSDLGRRFRLMVGSWIALSGCWVAIEASEPEIPLRAVAPEAGSPPAPLTSPGQLRFRKVPLKELESLEPATEVLGASDLRQSNLGFADRGLSDGPTDRSIRTARAGEKDTWEMEYTNPLRQGGSTTKKEPVVTGQATSGGTRPQEARLPTDAKPLMTIPLEEPKSATEDTAQELDPNTTQEKPGELSEESAAEEQDLVLRFHVEEDSPAPAPPGVKKQTENEAKPKKTFDPEDNDTPAGPKTESSDEESNSDVSDSDISLTLEDSSEPPSSELLRLLQENPTFESTPVKQPESSERSTSQPPASELPSSKSNSAAKPADVQRESLPTSKLASPKPRPQVLPQTARLRPRIDAALNYYLLRPETNVERSPWAVFHSILPFGSETTLRADGRVVSAISWMCLNGSCRGQRIFIPLRDGSFRPAVGAGVQGHDGQFLAILAQSKVPANSPIQAGRKRFTVEDLIDYEMRTCQSKTELTFKLIALSHYLINDATWVNGRGEEWSLERLVEEELAQPIIGSACGGTHRLMGLSFALKQRRASGLPVTGHYARAEVFLKDFVDYAWTLQNPDGSFSTEWFEGRANKQDMQRKLQTTGHVVEWLVYTLPDEELQSPKLLRAIEFLTYCLVEQRQTDWKIGPRSHALHALAMYQERLFGVTMGTRRSLATAASRNSRR